MAFKVYNEEKDPEKDIYFRLVEERGGIKLVVCDSEGVRAHQGDILEIRYGGALYRYLNVAQSLGLELGKGGRIKDCSYD